MRTSREITDRESEHVAALIRRGGEDAVAALLGVSDATLRSWQKRERWPAQALDKAMTLTLDDVPRKGRTKRPKPPPGSRLMVPLTRSELLYYRED